MEDVFTQENVSLPLEKQLVDCVVLGSQEIPAIMKLENVLVCVFYLVP